MIKRALALGALVACSGGDHSAARRPPRAGGAGAAAGSQWITADGVGPVTATTDPKSVAALFPGMVVKTEHTEGEDHSSDDTAISNPAGGGPVLHVVVDNMRDENAIFRVDVVGPGFVTRKQIGVGSSVGELAAAYPDAACTRATYDPNPEDFDRALFCKSASLPNVTFHLDPDALAGPDGAVPVAKLAALEIDRIIWMPAAKGASTSDDGAP